MLGCYLLAFCSHLNILNAEILTVKTMHLSKEMIDEADRDGDGEINEQEFLRIMKKTSLY